MIRLTEEEFKMEVRRLICAEFMKRYISSIPSSQKDIDKFNENYEKISLNESLCVYDNLQADIDKILDAIMSEYEAQKDKIEPMSGTCDFRGYPQYVNGIKLEVKSPINCLDTIETTVYDFDDINDYHYNVSNRIFKSSYDPNNNKIVFDIGLFHGKLYKESFMAILSHELRHFYDIRVNRLYGKKFAKRIYKTANEVMKLYNAKEPDINYNIAGVLYLSDKSEILANCQLVYNEIKLMKITSIKELEYKSEIYSQVCSSCKYINSLINNSADDISKYDKNLFCGLDLNIVIKYLEPRVRNMLNKIGKAALKGMNENLISETFDYGVNFTRIFASKNKK